mmetsp:Transcript_17926/g.27723  ORF Transcript_17926/g.27723 Transcript_17926/m.27723 type:complete len:167 (+) Transcript_17926:550-1050(+)|eukprot:CAMPEP_0184326570 /NCGR_PEP_ID=MMETSP1049-20130417/142634_1 /TAXON_ID=77928 /ORGANISM="Proteomonas sulcata, Strain CCMP704" /LENGTH=166 /DNA_ID=CAMNT_0026648773 /DNA_START=1354 /DNA_END=1854 /DNA_ORIENTATION=+
MVSNRPAAGKAAPLQASGLGNQGTGGLASKTPNTKRRALGDITNSRNKSAGPREGGPRVQKATPQVLAAAQLVEAVDTATRFADKEAPFSDPALEGGVDVLLKTIPSSQVRGGLAPLAEDIKFRSAEFQPENSPTQDDDDGIVDMLLEDDEMFSFGDVAIEIKVDI